MKLFRKKRPERLIALTTRVELPIAGSSRRSLNPPSEHAVQPSLPSSPVGRWLRPLAQDFQSEQPTLSGPFSSVDIPRCHFCRDAMPGDVSDAQSNLRDNNTFICSRCFLFSAERYSQSAKARTCMVCNFLAQWPSTETTNVLDRTEQAAFICAICRYSPEHEYVASGGGRDKWPSITLPGRASQLKRKPLPVISGTTCYVQSDVVYDMEGNVLTPPFIRQEVQTCSVCVEDIARSGFPSVGLTTSCRHPTTVCISCTQKWIGNQLTSNHWNQIRCPECVGILQYTDIQQHATREVLDRYDELAMRAALSEDPNFMWCRAPGCESGQIHEGGSDAPVFRCRACEYQYCVIHEVPWHSGETCTQYDARMDDEGSEPQRVASRSERRRERQSSEANEHTRHATRKEVKQIDRDRAVAEALQRDFDRKYKNDQAAHRRVEERVRKQRKKEEAAGELAVKQSAKRCPSCKFYIQKSRGCDHMTCTRCRHEFCWQCLADYERIRVDGNRYHASDCQYYA